MLMSEMRPCENSSYIPVQERKVKLHKFIDTGITPKAVLKQLVVLSFIEARQY